MIAVLGGIGAALAFSGTTLCYARVSGTTNPYRVLSWVMLVGLAVTIPLVAASGVPHGIGARELGWLALAGGGNVAGLLLTFRALRIGAVTVVAPITSTEGALAALMSVAAGEKLAAASAATLAAIAFGILLAALGQKPEGDGPRRARAPAAVAGALAVAAAVAFGASLFAVARVGQELPLAWALLPARLVGVLLVAVPLAATSGLRLTRRAARYCIAAGLFEVAGVAAYTVGARHGIAVSAVLTSQFGAIAALAGYAFFGERLTRLQIAGVATIAAGVAVLSALQA